MSEQNPFLGQTTILSRPTGSEPKYRYQTIVSLTRDQQLWDSAEKLRKENRFLAAQLMPSVTVITDSSNISESALPSVEGSPHWTSLLPPAPRHSALRSSHHLQKRSLRPFTGEPNESSHS